MPAARFAAAAVLAFGAAVPLPPAELGDRPARAVGTTERRDRIVSFVVPGSGSDGSDRIMVEATPGTEITGSSLSPSGALYYAESDGSLRLRSDDGRIRRLGQGGAPTVSADGRYLAYRFTEGCSTGIALRELASGDERRFPGPCDSGPVDHIAVDRKGERVAFTRADERGVWVFDPSATDLALARPVPLQDRYSYTAPVWMRGGRLVVGRYDYQRPSSVAELDVKTGRATVLAEDVDVAHLDTDSAGRRLLVSTWDNEPEPNIAVIDADGSVVEGRRPYGSAEW
jgi:hypothetical protein